MTATHSVNSTPSVAPVLYVAFELSNGGSSHRAPLVVNEPVSFQCPPATLQRS